MISMDLSILSFILPGFGVAWKKTPSIVSMKFVIEKLAEVKGESAFLLSSLSLSLMIILMTLFTLSIMKYIWVLWSCLGKAGCLFI